MPKIPPWEISALAVSYGGSTNPRQRAAVIACGSGPHRKSGPSRQLRGLWGCAFWRFRSCMSAFRIPDFIGTSTLIR
ncbi:hypothetical protein J7T55_005601 [Diaporthe amygdali]|uniref:uncharacterized protein n=1 Tax=Phomopsis amygdali TaxID=1214568 RepID=UPI0022FDD590|nr:uncharacterized protein J7T55_005601 [Diaporthe amygdali]KAJ0124263.1 hypothetical protein J7T55_005601 [Diaporthe amygdali]